MSCDVPHALPISSHRLISLDASSLCLRQAPPRQPPERTRKRNTESPTVIPRVHRQPFGNRSKSEHLCDTLNFLCIVLLMYNLWDYIPCKNRSVPHACSGSQSTYRNSRFCLSVRSKNACKGLGLTHSFTHSHDETAGE